MKLRCAIAVLFLYWPMVSMAADKHYLLEVDGLACPFCEYNVEKSLGKIDGIKEVKANLKDGIVSVVIADGKSLPEGAVRQAITDAGFTLREIQSPLLDEPER